MRDKWECAFKHWRVGCLKLSKEGRHATPAHTLTLPSLSPPPQVSIPYTAIDTISVRESKFGNTLVIALQGPNGLLFGFRVDPLTRLQELAKELRALREVAFTAPDFGVVHEHEEEEGGNVGATGAASTGGAASAVEEAEGAEGADEEVGGGGDAFAAYLAEGAKEGDRPVTFSHDLGLAIEQLPPGIALQQLWAAL